MHAYDLILTLTGGLAAALVLGYVTQRLGLSPIVGYLLAGTLVGPHTPGLRRRLRAGRAARRDRRHPADVRRRPAVPHRGAARRAAASRFPAPIAQSAVATLLGALLARAFGWDWSAGARLRHGAGRREHGRRSSACSPTTTTCTRRPATSRSAGWSSRTCSRSWRWCCCRRCSAGDGGRSAAVDRRSALTAREGHAPSSPSPPSSARA